MIKPEFKIGDLVKIKLNPKEQNYPPLAKILMDEVIFSGETFEIEDVIEESSGRLYLLNSFHLFLKKEELDLVTLDNGGL